MRRTQTMKECSNRFPRGCDPFGQLDKGNAGSGNEIEYWTLILTKQQPEYSGSQLDFEGFLLTVWFPLSSKPTHAILASCILGFLMTSRRPCWCPQKKKKDWIELALSTQKKKTGSSLHCLESELFRGSENGKLLDPVFFLNQWQKNRQPCWCPRLILGKWVIFICKLSLSFRLKNTAADHVSEN